MTGPEPEPRRTEEHLFVHVRHEHVEPRPHRGAKKRTSSDGCAGCVILAAPLILIWFLDSRDLLGSAINAIGSLATSYCIGVVSGYSANVLFEKARRQKHKSQSPGGEGLG